MLQGPAASARSNDTWTSVLKLFPDIYSLLGDSRCCSIQRPTSAGSWSTSVRPSDATLPAVPDGISRSSLRARCDIRQPHVGVYATSSAATTAATTGAAEPVRASSAQLHRTLCTTANRRLSGGVGTSACQFASLLLCSFEPCMPTRGHVLSPRSIPEWSPRAAYASQHRYATGAARHGRTTPRSASYVRCARRRTVTGWRQPSRHREVHGEDELHQGRGGRRFFFESWFSPLRGKRDYFSICASGCDLSA